MSSSKQWVVFGGKSPEIFDKKPFIAYGGSDTHYFPFAIHCQSFTQAQKLFALHNIIHSVLTQEAVVVACTFMDSDAAQGVLQKEIQNGKLQGSHAVLRGYENGYNISICFLGKIATHWYLDFTIQYVAWMIMKGQCINGNPIGSKKGIMKEKIVELPAVNILHHRTQTDPPLSMSSQAPHVPSHAPWVYHPPPADNIPLPSFGNVPDSYLEAHGYSHCALLCVQHALDVNRGLPVTEAQWLWFIITGDNDF
ncbi:hypothetical protein BDR04DRAFT_1117653 [Suillus decipiens]|nr:hypothetical protein BDR04DRAFT_1117653 [Suillus decipiens]